MCVKTKPFVVGDRVCVMNRGAPRSVTAVARVLKRFVETEDGCKWSTDGRWEYPRREFSWSSNYPSIEHLTPEHEKRVAELRAHIRLRNTLTDVEQALRNGDLTTEQMTELQTAIRRFSRSSQSEG